MSLKIKLAKTLTKDEDESKQSVSVDANSTGKELVDEISKLVRKNYTVNIKNIFKTLSVADFFRLFSE